jgi:predicted pyridoxine 5'-phosphate oxidase superfamily flavin-nucleotide-binding protein
MATPFSITDADTLQACVGALPGPRDLKVIDHLDATAMRWIAATPLLFAGFGASGAMAVTLAGGEAGFARVESPRQWTLPLALLDDPDLPQAGQSVCSLLLVPGLGETLRINGTVLERADGWLRLAVQECYLHCAKALIRSGFWEAQPSDEATPPPTPQDVVPRSRLLVLATSNARGQADLSPKGDPAGALLRLHDDALCFPDRPGNRRVDSFRNIIEQPQVAAGALIPGENRLLHVSGAARLDTDLAAREAFSVEGKAPKLVTCIAQPRLEIRHSPALARARLWPAAPAPADIEPAEIFKAHVKLNRTPGLQAAVARAGVSVPGLIRKSLDHDYKKNLY